MVVGSRIVCSNRVWWSCSRCGWWWSVVVNVVLGYTENPYFLVKKVAKKQYPSGIIGGPMRAPGIPGA